MNPELDALLGAYVLDAVDADERERLEAYLASDGDARREVDELRETVAMLALTQSEGEAAPPELWDRIEASIGERIFGDELGAQRARRTARRTSAALRPLLAVAAAVVLVAAGALGAVLVRHRSSSSTDLAAAYRSAARSGSAVAIASPEGRVLAHVAYTKAGNGYVRVDALAPLGAGRVYQLWVIPQGSDVALSAGVLGAAPKLAAFHWSGAAKAFAISEERAPGARVPGTVLGSGAF